MWLFATYGELAPIILFGAQFGMLCLDAFTFLLAALLNPRIAAFSLMPYLVGYDLFYVFLARFIRLNAFVQEWVLKSSYRDTFVPKKVRAVRG